MRPIAIATTYSHQTRPNNSDLKWIKYKSASKARQQILTQELKRSMRCLDIEKTYHLDTYMNYMTEKIIIFNNYQ